MRISSRRCRRMRREPAHGVIRSSIHGLVADDRSPPSCLSYASLLLPMSFHVDAQIGRTEGVRQQPGSRRHLAFAEIAIATDDSNIGGRCLACLEDNLATTTARSDDVDALSRIVRWISYHSYGVDIEIPGRIRRSHGRNFSAYSDAVRRVFQVRTNVDATLGPHRSPNRKFGIGRVRLPRNLGCFVAKLLVQRLERRNRDNTMNGRCFWVAHRLLASGCASYEVREMN